AAGDAHHDEKPHLPHGKTSCPQPSAFRNANNGGGGIRTHGEPKPTPVFKTGAFNHSATPPGSPDGTATDLIRASTPGWRGDILTAEVVGECLIHGYSPTDKRSPLMPI